MNLKIVDHTLRIELEWYEQLLAFTLNPTLEIPLEHIEAVTAEEPQSNWAEIRAPGTFLPGVIKAGTYYTRHGKEFWYVTTDKNYFTLVLQDEPYKRIILTLEDHEAWIEQIHQSQAI
jgi:hypothetical protein